MILLASTFTLCACTSDVLGTDTDALVSAKTVSTRSANNRGSMSIADSTLSVGDTSSLLISLRDRFGRNVSRQASIRYTTRDTSVASVSSRGLVTIRSYGVTNVVVQASNGYVDSILVGVTQAMGIGGVARSLPAVPPEAAPPSSPPVEVVPPALPQADLGSLPAYVVPMLPAASVNTTLPRVTGRSIRVPSNDAAALQAALNAAVGGDEVVLPSGAVYVGNFVLPKHSGTGTVTLRGEGLTTPQGSRLTPSAASVLASIETSNSGSALETASGAGDWRVIGLRFALRSGSAYNYGIVRLGSGAETALSQLVNNIILDRVHISGGETGNTSRCVGFNGNSIAIVDSWLADCHAKGFDAQGVGGWTGMGPFLIENNHIEGSGQAVMFGGADPGISNLTPSDITIRRNHFFKPLSWANGKWTVKAAFELKHARRVLFEGNVIENHWADAQSGFAILFQALNQGGRAPWTKVQDITVRSNSILNSTGGLNILSRYRDATSYTDEPSKRILVRNNLFLTVGRDPISGADGRLIQLLSDHEDVTIAQNTFFGGPARSAVMFDGEPNKRLMLLNNVMSPTQYGVGGSGYGDGVSSLVYYAPGSIVQGNVFTGLDVRRYPPGNAFPLTLTASDFVNAAAGNYSLRGTLTYSISAGALVGVDAAALTSATSNVVSR